MPSECAAAGCSEKLTKEFSFHAFPFKNEARKRQWQVAMNRWDLATKKWEPKHHAVLCSKQFNRLAISWPPWVRVWGWASDRFLPLTVLFFLFACPFVSRVIAFIYDVRVRGGSLDV